MTTHSPLVISDSKDVLVYALEDGQLVRVPSQYGQDANSVLSEVMDAPFRNTDVAKQLGDLLDHIQDQRLDKARELLSILEGELSTQHLELVKARLLLRKEELRRERNS